MFPKPRKINISQGELNAVELYAIVLEEPTISEWENGQEFKAKTCVKIQSKKTGKIIDFVTWKKFNVHKGDEIFALGKVNSTNEAFIGWADSAKILKRANE